MVNAEMPVGHAEKYQYSKDHFRPYHESQNLNIRKTGIFVNKIVMLKVMKKYYKMCRPIHVIIQC